MPELISYVEYPLILGVLLLQSPQDFVAGSHVVVGPDGAMPSPVALHVTSQASSFLNKPWRVQESKIVGQERTQAKPEQMRNPPILSDSEGQEVLRDSVGLEIVTNDLLAPMVPLMTQRVKASGIIADLPRQGRAGLRFRTAG